MIPLQGLIELRNNLIVYSMRMSRYSAHAILAHASTVLLAYNLQLSRLNDCLTS